MVSVGTVKQIGFNGGVIGVNVIRREDFVLKIFFVECGESFDVIEYSFCQRRISRLSSYSIAKRRLSPKNF